LDHLINEHTRQRPGEAALSDSWGPDYEERWITVEEASAISQVSMAVVTW
jgi:hypothetical protein